MTLTTDRIMNNARMHLPGVLDTVLQIEFFNVLNDFFQQSNIWQEDIPFAVKQGDTARSNPPPWTTYYIEQSTVSAIVRVLWIVNSAGTPVYGSMSTPGELILDTPPSQNDTYTATVALTVDDPVSKNTSFPNYPAWVVNKYSTGIIDGLVGRLMAQPAKPYSNPQLSLPRLRSYNSTISVARGEAVRRNINNAQGWRFPQFANRRRQ